MTPHRFKAKTPVLVLLAALLAALVPGLAQAAASAWDDGEQGRVRLISAGETTGGTADLRLGLHFDLHDDWKIYWRSPGDAGFPPEVDWSGSENLAEATLRWPVPHRFSLFGLETFGYGKEVVLPIAARAEDPSQPVKVRGEVNFLTCSDICVPRRATLALTLPPGGPTPSAQAHLIDRFRAQVPGLGAEAGLGLKAVTLTEGERGRVLEVRATARPGFDAPDAIVEGAAGHTLGKPEVSLRDGGQTAVLRLPVTPAPGGSGDVALDGRTVTLTVFDGQRGLERRVTLGADGGAIGAPPAAASASDGGRAGPGGGPPVPAAWQTFAGMLGLAVLGGLILNLMPCVLPVLSLKLLSVVRHGGGARREIRAGFLASAAGILASFLVLAAGAIALKAAGLAVGWGIQFQQPAFLVAMTLVVTLFAVNLFGLFEIPLPRPLANAAGRIGGAPGRDGGLAGHFATGALATLLATPCSAPFLGTAVAFALARGSVEILAIFLALGIGLALPYLAVAAVPRIAAAMPRPGAWMLRVKQVLGLALAATGVWLLSVLAAQRGIEAALAVGGLMLAAGVLIALRGRIKALLGRRALPAALAVVAVAAFATPPSLGSAPTAPGGEAGAWQPLRPERIPDLVDRGKIVFVDVTAEWCITCKVNKAAVIDSAEIQRLLAREEVVRMRGDWTRRDPAIAAYLARHDRYGIPFNAVYGPDAPEGIKLPEVLRRGRVAEAIDRAG